MGMEEKAIGQTINLGSSMEHKVIDMVNLINEITGNKARVKFTQRRDWDVKTRLLSSIDKAGNILGYKPEVEFEDGVRKIYEWFTENWDNIKVSAEF
ncbi:hypothetical protein ACFLTT_01500 [Chloroflexota bacterium]